MKFTDYDKYIKSTGTHYISNSGHDERGKYMGGTAGDQTGEEWKLKAWYNRPWSVVLRYNGDERFGYLMACLSCAAAINNKVGYDQGQRPTYWTQLSGVKYDPSAITVPCEEDCTAGVTANAKACGYILGIESLQKLSISIYSGNMKSLFVKAGFTALTESKYLTSTKHLKPGDVLLYEGHHAAANVTIGSSVRSSYKIPDMSGVSVPVKASSTTTTQPTTTTTTATVTCDAYTITASSLNIRKGPNTSYSVVDTLNNGDKIAKVNADGWTLVKSKSNVLCWISSKYISGGVVTGGTVNLRLGPATKYKVISVVYKEDVLEIVPYDGWKPVEMDGCVFWASAKYLK